MNRVVLSVTALLLNVSVANTSANVVVQFFEDPSLANQSPGIDYLWLTGDSGEGPLAPATGDNDTGSSTFWHTDNPWGQIGFFRNTLTFAGTLPSPGGAAFLPELSATNNTNEVYGVFGPDPAPPLSASPASFIEIFANQSVQGTAYFDDVGGQIRIDSIGWVFFPGDNAETFVGAGELANHINFLIGIAGGGHDAYLYLEGTFLDPAGNPNGFGTYSGFSTATTVIPLPPAALLMLAPIVALLRNARRI